MKLPKKKSKKKDDKRDVFVFLVIVVFGILALFTLFYLNIIEELALLLGIMFFLGLLYLKMPPFVIEIKDYERAVVFRMGKFLDIYGPGWRVLIPFIDEAVIIDTRVQTIDVPKQKVVTKDEIELTIDAIIYLKVVDVKKAVLEVRDYREAAVSATYAHLRDVIGKMTLSEVISNIDKINKLVSKGLMDLAEDWGVQIEKVEIKEVKLPEEVMDAMHKKKAAEEYKKAAEQEALANAIRIDAVREAAGKLNEPALQYLYLEALKKVAEGKSSKILFPVELSKMAERIAGITGKDYREVERDLRKQFKEFVREEKEMLSKSEKHMKHFLKKSVKPRTVRKTKSKSKTTKK